MLIHVDASNRTFAHADAGSAIAGNQAAQELEEIRIVSDEEDVLAVGVLVDEFLEIGVGGAEVEGGADFNLAVIAKFVADELGGLESAFERAGDDDIGLDFESAEQAAHQHALLFTFRDEPALCVELGSIAGDSSVGVAHEVKVHGGYPNEVSRSKISTFGLR